MQKFAGRARKVALVDLIKRISRMIERGFSAGDHRSGRHRVSDRAHHDLHAFIRKGAADAEKHPAEGRTRRRGLEGGAIFLDGLDQIAKFSVAAELIIDEMRGRVECRRADPDVHRAESAAGDELHRAFVFKLEQIAGVFRDFECIDGFNCARARGGTIGNAFRGEAGFDGDLHRLESRADSQGFPDFTRDYPGLVVVFRRRVDSRGDHVLSDFREFFLLRLVEGGKFILKPRVFLRSEHGLIIDFSGAAFVFSRFCGPIRDESSTVAIVVDIARSFRLIVPRESFVHTHR